MDSPGKNTGVGCHFLLQGIFLTHRQNLHLLCLLHWQADVLSLSHQLSTIKGSTKCEREREREKDGRRGGKTSLEKITYKLRSIVFTSLSTTKAKSEGGIG